MKKEKFSAFIDNELNGAEFDEMYSALNSDEDLKRRWQRYHIISDALQKHLPEKFDCNLADQVMLKIENEPAILAPKFTSQYDTSPDSTASKATATVVTTVATKSNKPFFKQIAGLAVAASVMIVAVFVTQTFVTNNGTTAVAPVATFDTKIPSMPAENQFARISEPRPKASPGYQNQLNKYLANHNQYSTSVPGVMPYARIIGYTPGRIQPQTLKQTDK